jgi:hypothetical protein
MQLWLVLIVQIATAFQIVSKYDFTEDVLAVERSNNITIEYCDTVEYRDILNELDIRNWEQFQVSVHLFKTIELLLEMAEVAVHEQTSAAVHGYIRDNIMMSRVQQTIDTHRQMLDIHYMILNDFDDFFPSLLPTVLTVDGFYRYVI